MIASQKTKIQDVDVRLLFIVWDYCSMIGVLTGFTPLTISNELLRLFKRTHNCSFTRPMVLWLPRMNIRRIDISNLKLLLLESLILLSHFVCVFLFSIFFFSFSLVLLFRFVLFDFFAIISEFDWVGDYKSHVLNQYAPTFLIIYS